MSTVTYLGEYATVRDALDDAFRAGDFTFYAPNFDIYVRVARGASHGVRVYHLVQSIFVDRELWTWQEMRGAR
jgi:hypothetical protein